jgi:2-methylisocitrate lyase-like PEP mutase family enzyme
MLPAPPLIAVPSTTQQRKAEAFAALNEGEPFVFPTLWDVGSARLLEALGFEPLATTSPGFALTLDRLDGFTTLEEVAAHGSALIDAVSVPVAVDLENADGPAPGDAAAAGRRIAAAGTVWGSIEDRDPDGRLPLSARLPLGKWLGSS